MGNKLWGSFLLGNEVFLSVIENDQMWGVNVSIGFFFTLVFFLLTYLLDDRVDDLRGRESLRGEIIIEKKK